MGEDKTKSVFIITSFPYLAPGPPTNVVTMATPSEGEIRVEWGPPVNLNGILIAYHATAVNTGVCSNKCDLQTIILLP